MSEKKKGNLFSLPIEKEMELPEGRVARSARLSPHQNVEYVARRAGKILAARGVPSSRAEDATASASP